MDVRRFLGLFSVAPGLCALGLVLVACGNDLAKAGEPCDVAADCDGDLVCALVAADAKIHECTPAEDTYAQENCSPGADLNMVCELIQLQPAGGPCTNNDQCKKGLSCDLVGDSGTEAACKKR